MKRTEAIHNLYLTIEHGSLARIIEKERKKEQIRLNKLRPYNSGLSFSIYCFVSYPIAVHFWFYAETCLFQSFITFGYPAR